MEKVKLSPSDPSDIHHFCPSLINTAAFDEDYGRLGLGKNWSVAGNLRIPSIGGFRNNKMNHVAFQQQ